ncbi:hypothetical protein AB6809_33605 [Paraburkholderia sp. RCC_158]|uniref:hypothetical protein n=1 Tax=Paraburkholderia sp. RCC_158 TaxID=3239220 RepID=UPI0035239D00
MMGFIDVTPEYGLVIRKDALRERNVSLEAVLAALKADAPLDSDDRLISFGPSFGQEALDGLIKELAGLGLQYFDDFVEVVGTYPEWCRFRVGYAKNRNGKRGLQDKRPLATRSRPPIMMTPVSTTAPASHSYKTR